MERSCGSWNGSLIAQYARLLDPEFLIRCIPQLRNSNCSSGRMKWRLPSYRTSCASRHSRGDHHWNKPCETFYKTVHQHWQICMCLNVKLFRLPKNEKWGASFGFFAATVPSKGWTKTNDEAHPIRGLSQRPRLSNSILQPWVNQCFTNYQYTKKNWNTIPKKRICFNTVIRTVMSLRINRFRSLVWKVNIIKALDWSFENSMNFVVVISSLPTLVLFHPCCVASRAGLKMRAVRPYNFMIDLWYG